MEKVTVKLSVKAAALTCSLLWGACVLALGLINLKVPGYGATILKMCSEIYPGYNTEPSILSVLLATAYALLDGLVCGSIVAFIYNYFAERK